MYEIIPDDSSKCGYLERETDVISYPAETIRTDENGNEHVTPSGMYLSYPYINDVKHVKPSGMYLLHHIPDGTDELRPQGFTKGGREELDKVINYMNYKFKSCAPNSVRDWEAFEKLCPKVNRFNITSSI